MAAGESSTLVVEVRGSVSWLLLDRPDRANAYLPATLEALEAALEELQGRPEVRCLVLGSSTPGLFCAGADLDELRRRGPEEALSLGSLRVIDALAACPLPSIAAVDGPAVGGGLELALACDLRLCTPRARFFLPETRHGVLPAAGATVRLPRLAGESVARRMILFGEELSAEAARACGLVAEVVSPEDLDQAVARWAARVAQRHPLALQLAKRTLQATWSGDGGRELVRSCQALLYQLQRPPERS